MASYSLVAYAFGLLGFMLVKVLAPGYFARQDTRTPVRVALIAMGVNMLFNIIFVLGLIQVGFVGPHMGLAMATTLSSFINAGLLLRGLRREGVYTPVAGWGRLLLQVGFASVAMGGLLLWFVADLPAWLATGSLERAMKLGGLIALGALSYGALLWLGGVRLRQLRRPAV